MTSTPRCPCVNPFTVCVEPKAASQPQLRIVIDCTWRYITDCGAQTQQGKGGGGRKGGLLERDISGTDSEKCGMDRPKQQKGEETGILTY